jgi:hypothetical protein
MQVDAKTGKIYLNIPEVNGSGNDTSPGAVVVIDPKSMSVEKVFRIPLSACTGPMGMTIGPENQILLGCTIRITLRARGLEVAQRCRGRAPAEVVRSWHLCTRLCPAPSR